MKKKLLILALHLASNGADAYFTHRNQSGPRPYELNPLAKPFVMNGTPLLIAGFSAETAIEIAVPFWLRKHGQPKLAGTLDIAGIGGHGWGAATSAIHQARSK